MKLTKPYLGRTTVKEVIKDHRGLKKQIKKREKVCDKCVKILSKERLSGRELCDTIDTIDEISRQMMSINI